VLSAAELALVAEVDARILRDAAKRTPKSFIPQEPTPKQAEFLALDCLEALYGGAAGGGKSSALLMAALQYVHVPGYAALILRRTYADLSLPGAIMDRAHDWLQGTGARWNDRDKRWTFPSGASLQFGYCETAKDVYRYQGAELQFLGWDELTQFPEQPYRYLLSRLRRTEGVRTPLRARAASNPGGLGHEWVKRRFLESTDVDRRFVAASLVDNPHLDQDEYRRALALLDATTRRQLEHGIWERDSGGLVYSFSEVRNLAKAPELTTYLLGIDYGFTDATAFTVLGWREGDPTVYVVESCKRRGLTPSDAAEEAKRLSLAYEPVRIVADVGGLGKGYAEEARKRFTLPIDPADKQNKRGYISLFNGELERGRIKVDPGCTDLVAEWLELPWTEDHAKEAEGFDNHCADSCLYAWRAASAYHEAPAEEPPSHAEQLARMEAALIEGEEEEARRRAEGEWWQ